MNREKLTKNDITLLKEKYGDNIEEALKKVDNYYPVQYLIGHVNFYGYQFKVDENVLIPRFETETLIEKLLLCVKKYNFNKPKILDIGTGSGCIAITLKKELDCDVTAIDISKKALEVAKSNASLNEVDISFVKKDILKERISNKYDIIISNPPYLTKGDEVSKELIYEPQNALYVEDDTIFYKEIIKKGSRVLNKKSIIAFETGIRHHKEIISYAQNFFPKALIISELDYNLCNRYIFIINE